MDLEKYYKKKEKYKIVTGPNCIYCTKAKKLMDNYNIEYEEHCTTDNKYVVESLKKNGFKTVPQIWNEQAEHIGGYDDLKEYIVSKWKHVGGYQE